MIALLRGTSAGKVGEALILDVNGVGYKVGLAAPDLLALEKEPGEITLHITTVVKEDDIALFGFRSPAQREVFELLRSVSGIGPKLALAVLSGISVEQLGRAIAADDTKTLAKVPGVGAKTAARLCLELKGKLAEGAFVPTVGPAQAADPLPLALARLDYRKSEIDAVLASADVPKLGEAPLEARVRAALRLLARPM